MDPRLVMWKDVWSEGFDGPQMCNLDEWLVGYLEVILVGNFGTVRS